MYSAGIELLLAAALAMSGAGMQWTHFMFSCTAASARMPNEASDWLLPQIRIEAGTSGDWCEAQWSLVYAHGRLEPT